jgi:hypothetical protein
MAEPKAETQGLIIKDENGQLYFLRPEILEMCRVRPEDARTYKPLHDLEEKVSALHKAAAAEGVTSSFGNQASVLAAVTVGKEIDAASLNKLASDLPKSTLMCPW